MEQYATAPLDATFKEQTCPFCEGLGVEDPEMDPAIDCCECNGMGTLTPTINVGALKEDLGDMKGKLKKWIDLYESSGIIMVDKNPCCEMAADIFYTPYTYKESYDRNETLQDFSLHKSRRLLDLQS